MQTTCCYSGNPQDSFIENPQLKRINFQSVKLRHFIHRLSDKGLKGTVVNWIYGGLPKITSLNPLSIRFKCK